MKISIEVSPKTYLRNPNDTELGRKILTHSIELIDELGFEAFTFKKLGLRIGSPESSIYRYFENKHMLLIYLTYWYWSWIEYRLAFATANIKSPKEKLINAISVLTAPIEMDNTFMHINEVLLDKIVMKEGIKTYYIKEVDEENEKGYFKVYQRVIQQVSELVMDYSPKFEYAQMLVSTVIGGTHQQRYFANHFPALTNVRGKDSITNFYIDMVFKMIEN